MHLPISRRGPQTLFARTQEKKVKINNLTEGSNIYTCNAYLLTGTWNTVEDENTLVDVGRDPAVIEAIDAASTGVGKKRISQVIITHEHYDHTAMLAAIKERYSPKVYAFSRFLDGVDRVLVDGEKIRCGDTLCEVIYIPGHSNDSVCLYCEENKVLFSGDTPLQLTTQDQKYCEKFCSSMKYLSRKNIEKIYPGHGPVIAGGSQIIRRSVQLMETIYK